MKYPQLLPNTRRRSGLGRSPFLQIDRKMADQKGIPMIHIINPFTSRNNPVRMSRPSVNIGDDLASLLIESRVIHAQRMLEIQIVRSSHNLDV